MLKVNMSLSKSELLIFIPPNLIHKYVNECSVPQSKNKRTHFGER